MRCLVTGAAGQVGHELCQRLGKNAIPKTREAFDVTNEPMVRQTMTALRPELVVHAAGRHIPEGVCIPAESSRCWEVNALGTRHLVRSCREHGIPFVYISTNRIFGRDKTQEAPYTERHVAGPVCCFGESKLAGEHAVLQAAATCPSSSWEKGFRWWIVRTANLYEKPWRPWRNLVQTLTGMRTTVPVLRDSITSFTYVPHFVDALLRIINDSIAYPDGVYHVCNPAAASYHEFAMELKGRCGLQAQVVPETREAYAQRMRLPLRDVAVNTALSPHKSFVDLPPWREGVAEFCASIP